MIIEYTLTEVARRLRVSKQRASVLVRTGRIPAHRRAGDNVHWWIHAADLDAFLAELPRRGGFPRTPR